MGPALHGSVKTTDPKNRGAGVSAFEPIPNLAHMDAIVNK
jgi:hypothetical protein